MTEESSFVLQGSVSSVAVAFFQQAVLRMIPYAIPSVFLIFLDLIYGIKRAKSKKEKVRLSTAVRRSVTKTFSYVCWLILASTMALAFQQGWLEWVILGLVYLNEFASIVGNYLETKGITFSWVGFYRWVVRVISGKAGVVMEEAEAAEIIKRPRNKKGQFVSTKKK